MLEQSIQHIKLDLIQDENTHILSQWLKSLYLSKSTNACRKILIRYFKIQIREELSAK